MSAIVSVSREVKDLSLEEFKILKVFASGLKHHDVLTINDISSYSKIHEDIVKHFVSVLLRKKLISSVQNGFRLLSAGLDVVGLKMLVDNNIIEAIGSPIGIGKESDVIEAVSETDKKLALKFFRMGRTSFTNTKKKRSFESKGTIHSWLLLNINGAIREYDILNMLKDTQIRIAKPHFRSMHILVLDLIYGTRLVDKSRIKDPQEVFDDIIRQIKISFRNKIINCDISEYNILIDDESDPWIIDWPQAVQTNHPNSEFLLKRDIKNVVNFFKKKYRLENDVDDIYNNILRNNF